MEVILSIVFVVAGVSIYEFYSARKWQQETSIVRNDIVFQNRNQAYGAYVLRRNYDKNMVYIMLGVILSMGLIFGSFAYFKGKAVVGTTIPYVEIDGPTIEIVQKDEQPIKEPKKTITAVEKTKEFVEFKATDKPEIKKVLTNDELEKSKVGTVTQGKDSTGIIVDNTIKVVVKKDPPKPPVIEPTNIPEVDPSFFNLSAFIQKRLVYPQTAIEAGLQGKCYLKFVVNIDGSVSDVSVIRGVPDCPECDREAVRVIRQMKDWKPGVNDGKQVRSWMQLPINFTLQ